MLKKIKSKFIVYSQYKLYIITILFSFIFIGCTKDSNVSLKQEIVSLSPNISEIIGVFFPDVHLAGRTAACDYPESVKNAKIVCKIKPNIESLYALRPQKIFLEGSLFQKREIAELGKVAPVLPFCSEDLKNYLQSLRSIDTELGGSKALKQYIEKLENRVNVNHHKRFIILLDGGPKSNYFIAGKEGFLSDILKIAGYTCVGPKGKNFQEIDIETLLNFSFDGIITGTDSMFIGQDFRLKKYKITKIPDALLFRAGARVDQLISLLRK